MAYRPSSVLVTGANRGIGLELVRQLSKLKEAPEVIFATYRRADDAKDLFSLSETQTNVRPIQLDVCDEPKYASAVAQVSSVVGSKGLNLLIHNAGVLQRPGSLESLSRKEFMDTYEINAVAPVLLTRAFLPLLRTAAGRDSTDYSWTSSAIVNIGALWGSIAHCRGDAPYAYAMSKAALNYATKALSRNLEADKILVVSIHPGWVQTDMGGKEAPLTTQGSVAQVLDTLPKLTVHHNGGFLNYDGAPLDY